MRFLFRLGFVPEPKPPIAISASEDGEEGRWVNGSLDLKTIVAVGSLVLGLVAMRVDTSSKLAAGEVDRKQLRADVDRLTTQMGGKASREDLRHLSDQIQQDQRQVYQVLLQQARLQ